MAVSKIGSAPTERREINEDYFASLKRHKQLSSCPASSMFYSLTARPPSKVNILVVGVGRSRCNIENRLTSFLFLLVTNKNTTRAKKQVQPIKRTVGLATVLGHK